MRPPPIENGSLTSRPEFQTFKSGGNVDADLALHAERLQGNGIVGAADQHIAAGADAKRGTALRAGVSSRQIARPEMGDRREDAPGQRGFLGDTDIQANLADGRDVAILGHALDTQYAAEIGDGADDEADRGAAAAFEHANLHTRHRRLRTSATKRNGKSRCG